MKRLSVLIKPASSLCNMRCKYCFYSDVSSLRQVKSHGIMKEDLIKKMIDQIYLDLDDDDIMTFAFQGGEPTLASLDYFKKFTSYVLTKEKKVKIQYLLQTNGLLINEKWCEFFIKHKFLIGLSIDGGKIFHDNNRLDSNKNETYKRIMQTKNLFDKFNVEYNILCVLTNQIARHPQQVFNFIKKEKIRYIQFIPCLNSLDTDTKKAFSLQPERFATFYNNLFKLWGKELLKNNYISIKLFDDIINLLTTSRPTVCGMLGKCQPQYVIESDGSTYPCDFYVLDKYKMGNITKQRLSQMKEALTLKTFLLENKNKNSKYCKECLFLNICYGGCKRMKDSVYLNKEENYCGYQEFLTNNIDQIQSLIRKL